VLVAVRDSETRVLFCGIAASYKLFVSSSPPCCRVAGALYAPRSASITPPKGGMGVLPSIEMVCGWRRAGGHADRRRAGAIGVNWMQSWLTTSYPDVWLLFSAPVHERGALIPDGVVGAPPASCIRSGGGRETPRRAALGRATSFDACGRPRYT